MKGDFHVRFPERLELKCPCLLDCSLSFANPIFDARCAVNRVPIDMRVQECCMKDDSRSLPSVGVTALSQARINHP